MTILVGVLCRDGAVIGADSSVTFGGGGGLSTIEQMSSDKVCIIQDEIIVAGCGSAGLCQRFEHVVEGFASKVHSLHPVEVGMNLSRQGLQNFQSTGAPPGAGALVAFRTGSKIKKTSLCELDVETFQPELKTEQLWYCSMGSGQLIVDPFLGLFRRVFWKNGQPNCQEGVFAVTWALRLANELNSGGIGGPSRIAVLRNEPSNGEKAARFLTDDEISQHEANCDALEEYMARYRLEQTEAVNAPDSLAIPKVAIPAPATPVSNQPSAVVAKP